MTTNLTLSGELFPDVPDPVPTGDEEPSLVHTARRWRAADPAVDPALLLAALRRSTLHLPAEAEVATAEGGTWLAVYSTPGRAAEHSGAETVAVPGHRLLADHLPAGAGLVVDPGEEHALVLPAAQEAGDG